MLVAYETQKAAQPKCQIHLMDQVLALLRAQKRKNTTYYGDAILVHSFIQPTNLNHY